MTATKPAHTDLLGDTDLFIRAVAEAADRKVSASIKWAVMPPTDLTTNANGDVTCTFPGLPVLSGAIIYPTKAVKLNGPTTQYPSDTGVPYIVSPRAAFPVLVTLNPVGGPGTCWVRIFVGGWSYSFQGTLKGWLPSERAAANQGVQLGGIAWGPP